MSPTTTRSPETDDRCPAHYRIPDAECKKCGHPIQPVHLLQSLDGLTYNICKYAIRAGSKIGEPTLKDLKKCEHYLNLAIEREVNRQNKAASGPDGKPE